jgi:hypothetical protein
MLAFAGRPIYVCTMEQMVTAAAEAPCGHADCEHCPAPQQSESDCMLDASNPTAPAVAKAEIAPAIPQLIAGLEVVSALLPAGRAPSLPPDVVYESPPSSITILRI